MGVFMGVFVCLDGPWTQAGGVQPALFVCLDTIWARVARCFKQPRARLAGNGRPLCFSGARLISATRVLSLAVGGLLLSSRALQ